MAQSIMDPRGSLEQLYPISDPSVGLSGAIAIHSTALGPAAGGCRFWHYADAESLEIDAARLARGMSYKNALAGLSLGGGKAVIQRPSGDYDRIALFRAFGRAVADLGGRYVTAEDVGTNMADMAAIRTETRYVAGLEAGAGKAGGDPSPWTALGVFKAMQAAAGTVFASDLRGLRVAVQGVGNVGAGLCRLLADAGAKLIISDIDTDRARALAERIGAQYVFADDIFGVDAEILAPCALGAVLDSRTIPLLKMGLICGAANNQLATEADGEALLDRGIVYAPDYVVNAGGIINVAAEYLGEPVESVAMRIDGIASRLTDILDESARDGRPSQEVADSMARRLIAQADLVAA